MSYSDFTLKKVKEELHLGLIEDRDLFYQLPEIRPSELLVQILDYNVPLALAVGTEKARSEFIISNVLLEVRRMLSNKISLFSGVALDVDKEKGLTGFCDFLISKSSEQLYVTAPIITVVEAKNEFIVGGLGQCIAEMYASSLFNIREGSNIASVYGVVTTGTAWKFLKLENDVVYIDFREYYISDINKIVSIFVEMVS